MSQNPWLRIMFRTTVQSRGYGLGQRNPETLPDGTRDKEGIYENESKSRGWRSMRRQVQYEIGMKYI